MREKGARKRGRDQNCVREGVRECRVGMQRALLAARLMTQIVARSLARALSINQGAAGLAVNVCMCVCVCVCVRARAPSQSIRELLGSRLKHTGAVLEPAPSSLVVPVVCVCVKYVRVCSVPVRACRCVRATRALVGVGGFAAASESGRPTEWLSSLFSSHAPPSPSAPPRPALAGSAGSSRQPPQQGSSVRSQLLVFCWCFPVLGSAEHTTRAYKLRKLEAAPFW